MKIRLGLSFLVSLAVVATVCAQEDFKFKDADIGVVLQALGQKATVTSPDGQEKRVNIIVSPKVKGLVTVSLGEVNWLTALEGILKAHGYGYEWIEDDLILVATLEELAATREKDAVAAQQEPLETLTYSLKFLDAHDVKKLIEPQLTPRGRVSVLEVEPQKGWRARGGYQGGTNETSAERAIRETGARPRAKTLVITDAKSNIRELGEAIKAIDIMPRQVLIRARLMEVSRDRLNDIGLELGTGSTGASGTTFGILPANDKNSSGMGGFFSGNVEPQAFAPSADISGIMPYSAGLEFVFRKFTGAEFEAILHALEEDVHTNTLSAPHIVTLDGQEAYIIVGKKRPIITSTIASQEGVVTITRTLEYYQNLGIELNVVPYVSEDNFINMAIYPSVTSSSEDVTVTSEAADETITDSFPILDVRETQTQVMLKDGDTVMIGGLLKDAEMKSTFKVPLLGDLPLVGPFFRRDTVDIEKMDLVIFITAHIIDPGKTVPQAFMNTKPVSKELKKRDHFDLEKK